MNRHSDRKPATRVLTGLVSQQCRALIFASLVFMAAPHSALAGTGFRLMLPGWPQKQGTGPMMGGMTTTTGGTVTPLAAPTTPATGNRTGLVLTLDTTWIDARGYRPVRITVAPTAPTTADRSLRVSFRPGNQSVAVTGDIDLPAGFTSVTTTLSVPQFALWHSLAFDVFEDGEHLRELSIPQNSFGMAWNQYSGDNASPSILVLNTNANSNLMLNALARSGQPVLQVGQSAGISASPVYIPGNPPRQIISNSTSTIPTMADLPVRWIDYSALDIIVASRQDLQTLVKQHPQQWTAIRRWLSAGGNLWVYSVGQEGNPWEYLETVNGWMEFAPPDDLSPWKDAPEALHGWIAPDPDAPNVIPEQVIAYGTRNQVFITQDGTTQAIPTVTQPVLKDQRSPFVMRPLGQGLIVAIPSGDPSNNPNFRWDLLFNNVRAERWHWSTRHGVNFSGQNENYWNFLIPGVGAAPVTAFQVLITLFVLAIGPVNFYLLRRWHKLNLLLITVPTSAAIITVALLSYAVFSDGFGVQARTRSFTELNQQTGEATCLGRMTYYAGLTPSKGLSFSGDTTVYPLTEQPDTHQFESGPGRRLAWVFDSDEDRVGRQQLESGWLQSRIQTQLLTVRSRKTAARLDIAPESSRAASVTNQLSAPVSVLLVCDAGGDYSTARDIATGASAQLTALGKDDVPPEIIALNRDKTLRPPEGVELSGSHSIFGIRRRYYGRMYGRTGMGVTGTIETGMLERSLDEAITSAVLRKLPRRSYIAVVDRSPEFEIGLESAAEESSLHVIHGRW